MFSHRDASSAILVLLLSFSQESLAGEPRLFVDWPADWEFRQTAHAEQQAVYVQGRQRSGDRVYQELAMTVIDTDAARASVTSASIEDLVYRLHRRFPADAGVGEIRALADARGYYFIVTGGRSEDSPRYSHHIEGVMLDSGYVIEFVLRSNDAHAAETSAMLSALEKLTIR